MSKPSGNWLVRQSNIEHYLETQLSECKRKEIKLKNEFEDQQQTLETLRIEIINLTRKYK